MPFLDAVPEVRQLAPGVRLLCVPEWRFKRALLDLHFDRPLDDRSPARTLLCQVLEQGTSRHGSRMALARALEELYGATVQLEGERLAEMHRLTLNLSWVGERFLPAAERRALERNGGGIAAGVLDLGRELLEDPLRGDGAPFPPETVERERAQLVRRIRSLRDDRQAYAEERFLAVMCAGEPFGRPPYGTEEEAAALTAEGLEAARLEVLGRAQVTAVAVGPLDSGQVEDALLEWLGPAGPHAAAAREEPPPPVLRQPARVREVREDLAVDQARFFFGLRFLPPETPEEMEAQTLASGLLGGGSHGRLFRVVREERSLAYGIHAYLRMRKGILTVEAGIDAGSYDAVRDEVLAQVAALAAGKFTGAELEMARANILNDLQSLADSAGSMAHYFARELHLGCLRSPAQRAAELRALEPGAVAAAAASWAPDTVYFLAAPESAAAPAAGA